MTLFQLSTRLFPTLSFVSKIQGMTDRGNRNLKSSLNNREVLLSLTKILYPAFFLIFQDTSPSATILVDFIMLKRYTKCYKR